MKKLRYDTAPRTQTPVMNKAIVLESYKAVCLLIDWVRAVVAEREGRVPAHCGEGLDRWSFLEHISGPEVVNYGQIDSPERLRRIMAGLELALLLTAEKGEAFEVRREWQKLWRWMNERYDSDPAASGLTFINFMTGEGEMAVSEALLFMIEHLPEMKSGWSEGGADALNDYLYVMWLEARGV